MRFFRWSMVLFFLLTFSVPALAGVVVKDKNGHVSYFSSGKVKDVPAHDDNISIFNMNDNIMTLINSKKKVYTSATTKQFCQAIKAMREEAMGRLSPEQRKMMRQFMSNANQKAPKVVVKSLGGGGKIAGYPSSKYLVMADGKKFEEVYLAEGDFPATREMSLDRFWDTTQQFMACSTAGFGAGAAESVETSPAYQKLMRSGFPLKTIEYKYGQSKVTDQVVSVQEKSLSDTVFKAPAGYKKLEVRAFFEQQRQSAMESSQ